MQGAYDSGKPGKLGIFTRDSIYAIAHICHANSVCLSVRHTRVLYQNG